MGTRCVEGEVLHLSMSECGLAASLGLKLASYDGVVEAISATGKDHIWIIVSHEGHELIKFT